MIRFGPALKLVFLSLILFAPIRAELLAQEGKGSSGSQWKDDFSAGVLDLKTWKTTRAGDFRESKVDVVDLKPKGGRDFRLRFRANTLGTDDGTVKFLGVQSVRRIDFKQGATISLDLDWNDQANGSYLTAAIYLCPTSTAKNPQDEANWLRFEYVGVPPGKNARATVAAKADGQVRWLSNEGWPDKNREGRKISLQRLTFEIDSNRLVVHENGNELYRTESHGLNFTQAHLYLQMSSHSNYPPREIYFDKVSVRPL